MIKSIKQQKKMINKLKKDIELKDRTIVAQATCMTYLSDLNKEMKEEHEQIIGKKERKHQRLLKFQKKYQKTFNRQYWQDLYHSMEDKHEQEIRDLTMKNIDNITELLHKNEIKNKELEEEHEKKIVYLEESYSERAAIYVKKRNKARKLMNRAKNENEKLTSKIEQLNQRLETKNLIIEELSKDGELWMDKHTEEQHKNFLLQEKLDRTEKYLAEANDALINHNYQRQDDSNNWSLFDDVNNAPEMCGICYSSGSDRIYKCNNSIHNCNFYFHEACTLRNLMYGTRKLECLYCLKTNFAPFEMRAIN